MTRRRREAWMFAFALLPLALFAVTQADGGGERPPSAEAVIKLWTPALRSTTDFSLVGGTPKTSPSVEAHTFRVTGPTFGDLWNHYAKLCGANRTYSAKTFVTVSGANEQGAYVVSDRASADGKGDRGPSVFLLRTNSYTATATIMPATDGKSVTGSLTAFVP